MLKFKFLLALLCIFMCKEAWSQVTLQPTVPTTMPGPLTTAIPQRPINVGVLIPKSDPVLATQVGYGIFQVRFDECEEDLSMGFAAELIQDYSVDLIIGPTCNTRNSLALGRALVAVMKQFSWAQFAFIYSTDDQKRCSFIQNDIETAVDESSYDLYISFSRRVDNTSLESLKQVLLEGVKVARIFSMCFDSDSDKRTFFLAVHDLGLNTNDYVFILLELRNLQFSISKSFILDVSGETTANLTSFRKRVIEEVQGWPFYCSECAQANGTSTFARHLADTFYLYGVALNKTITQMLSTNVAIQTLRLGQQIVDNAIGYSFVGLSGQVTIDSTGSRDSIFHLSGLTPTTSEVAYIEIRFEDSNWTVTPLYSGDAIWVNRGGVKPSDQPKCGFDGTKCPLLIIFLLFGTIAFFVQTRRNEIKRQNLLWQVQYLELQKPLTKSDPNFQSQRSFHSGKQSSSTQMTLESKKESRNYLYFYYHGDSVAARKFQARMCRFENENVEKFVGLCLDGPLLMAIWRFYDRGSIQDVIQKGSFAMDGVFMLSLIRDIANGIGFIHASNFLECHGRLTSTVCLVDERWVVKIGDYGLGRLYDEEPMEIRQFLWMAPEHIRQGDNRGSKQGDIYSFAIICSEVVTRRPAWGYESNNEKLEAIDLQ
ncbi:receptor family ligand binding region domain-containing protein [Ditylenchus destructor]|nr:receptor family ligand binding region domain-containing protein [Ditylenchus destructor]